MRQITIGSLFDGIGAFPYAASLFGIKTVWASEILPAAISVTRRHFPDMVHVGDVTKLSGALPTPVDVIVFGSPCQDLSQAAGGNRKGLDGEPISASKRYSMLGNSIATPCAAYIIQGILEQYEKEESSWK